MKKKLRTNKRHSVPTAAILKSIGLGILAVLFVVICYGIAKMFTVQTVHCELSTGEKCPAELSAQLAVLHNTSLFFTNYEKVLHDSTDVTQPYSLTSTSKQLPKTLLIVFSAEQPLVLIKQADAIHVISRSGKAFPQTGESANNLAHLPVVETNEQLVEDNKINPDVLTTLITVIDTSQELIIPVEKITWLDKSTIKLSMKERSETAIIDSESPRLELQRLSLVLQSKEYQALTESKQELDLRFIMPVLRTTP